jgi:putative phosphoribosyl transferase
MDAPLFADRTAAGRALAEVLGSKRRPELVVVGLARGGVEVAAEVARALAAPLDVLAVRKIAHPLQPEYGIGAVTPGAGVYLRRLKGVGAQHLAAAVGEAKAAAELLDRHLHSQDPALDLDGRIVVLIDDGVATGATIVAAVRWARTAGATSVVVAVPVAAAASLIVLRREADEVISLYAFERFISVGGWYRSFPQVHEADVVTLLKASRRN